MRDKAEVRKGMNRILTMPDDRSFGVYKMFMDVYPAFAKKIFEGNKLMFNLVMSNTNPMDILDYAVCGKCESLAPYSGYRQKKNKRYRKCTCVKPGCGVETVNPVTLKVWCEYELKKKVPEGFSEVLDIAFDTVMHSMLRKARMEMATERQAFNEVARKKMGVSEGCPPDSIVFDKPTIQHLGNTTDPKLPKDRVEITEELDDEE